MEFWAHSRDIHCIVADNIFERVSDAYGRLLGRPLILVEGHSITSYTHPDDVDLTNQVFAAVLEDDVSITGFCNRVQHEDGSYRMLEWSLSAPVNGRVFASARLV